MPEIVSELDFTAWIAPNNNPQLRIHLLTQSGHRMNFNNATMPEPDFFDQSSNEYHQPLDDGAYQQFTKSEHLMVYTYSHEIFDGAITFQTVFDLEQGHNRDYWRYLFWVTEKILEQDDIAFDFQASIPAGLNVTWIQIPSREVNLANL